MSDETTIRNLSTDLARLEGATEAKIARIEEDVTEIKKDMKEVLGALQGHATQLAENRGRDKLATAGISVLVAGIATWVGRHF